MDRGRAPNGIGHLMISKYLCKIECDATKFEIFLVWVAPAKIFMHGCYSDHTPERRIPWG